MSSNTTPTRNSITHRTDGTTHEFRWMGTVLVIEEWDNGTLYIEGFRNRSTVKGRGRKLLCFVLEQYFKKQDYPLELTVSSDIDHNLNIPDRQRLRARPNNERTDDERLQEYYEKLGFTLKEKKEKEDEEDEDEEEEIRMIGTKQGILARCKSYTTSSSKTRRLRKNRRTRRNRK
jgi:hypothetical protein